MKKLVSKIFTGEFIRFVIVGGISAVLEYSLYFLFKNFFDYLTANVVAFILTNIVTFVLTRRYVFVHSTNNKTSEAVLFTICLAGALAVSQAVLWALVEFLAMDDKIAKALAIAVAVIWNFFTRKYIVFRQRPVVVATKSESEIL
jgi:putative flippase GtrA